MSFQTEDRHGWKFDCVQSTVSNERFQAAQGIDYDETFSPVAIFKSIRILLAIAAFHNYEIW